MIVQGEGRGNQQTIKKEKYRKLTAKGGGRSYRALKWD